MTNWQNIHLNFTPELQGEWEHRGFSYSQVKEWIDIGLLSTDANFVHWLEKNGYTALAVLNYADHQVLRKDYQKSLDTLSPRPIHHKPSMPSWKVIIAFFLTLIATYLLTN